MAKPIVLISSCSETEPVCLVQKIYGDGELPQSQCVIEDIKSYPWNVDTRYYTADILLCVAPSRTIGNEQFAEKVEAFIVHFDSTKLQSFESVKMWLPFLNQLEPEVRILLCDACKDGDEVSRIMAWQWCLENSFELVELDPIDGEGEEEDLEDDFPEAVGIERIIQALHNHTWSNLVMKETPNFRSAYMSKMMKEHAQEQTEEKGNEPKSIAKTQDSTQTNSQNTVTEQTESDSAASETVAQLGSVSKSNSSCEQNEQCLGASADAAKTDKECKNEHKPKLMDEKNKSKTKNKDEVVDSLIDEDKLAMLASLGDEGDEDTFEKLFENFRLMKDKADALPFEERKQYAEKVAIQFWKAIGGDEDEIEGLDSDLEDEDGG